MDHRLYDLERDAAALWKCKATFERELGRLGGGEKADTYDGKLTEDYRERYLAWVERCVERDADCVTVAESSGGDGLAGYVFVLPGVPSSHVISINPRSQSSVASRYSACVMV